MAYKPCKHLQFRSKRFTVNDVGLCTIEIPMPTLPISVTKAYGFNWPPSKSYVGKEDCAECPLFCAND